MPGMGPQGIEIGDRRSCPTLSTRTPDTAHQTHTACTAHTHTHTHTAHTQHTNTAANAGDTALVITSEVITHILGTDDYS